MGLGLEGRAESRGDLGAHLGAWRELPPLRCLEIQGDIWRCREMQGDMDYTGRYGEAGRYTEISL